MGTCIITSVNLIVSRKEADAFGGKCFLIKQKDNKGDEEVKMKTQIIFVSYKISDF